MRPASLPKSTATFLASEGLTRVWQWVSPDGKAHGQGEPPNSDDIMPGSTVDRYDFTDGNWNLALSTVHA